MLLASSIKPGRTPVLAMDALDETGDVAGTPYRKGAGGCGRPHRLRSAEGFWFASGKGW